ncbi:MAG: Gfo/Idh/MocA family oxidoreductase [Planctomycetes bacterium]|nr:Gfo/Idh/MocA family oxidoreductase [Planctomycetota bacterium]
MLPLKSSECRWGILSTAGIAKKNWRAISRSNTGRVAAVASRDMQSAQRFIDECQSNCPFKTAPIALGSYQSLLESKEVDAVYIPLPTGIRKEWILAAAKHGKHILAEKPAALTAQDVQEILDACKSNGVQFMDGVMFMHSQRLGKLRETLQSPSGIGALKRIATQFSFHGDQEFRTNNIRSNSNYEPHGSLGDLGWYTIRMILWVNQWRMPTHVSARCISTLQGNASPNPVPMEFSAELQFDNGVSASFYVSFATEHQQWCHISGEKGSIWIDDFVLPCYGSNVGYDLVQPEFVTDVCDFHMHRRSQRFSVAEYDSGHSPSQEINMFNTFHNLLQGDRPDESWGRMTLQTQQVLDAVFQAGGCKL